MPRRRVLLALTAGSLLAPLFAAPSVRADTFPSKPIRVIVPFPPGGTMDSLVRLVGNAMEKRLGQPIILDNRPGAGTVIGVDACAKAAPDGYTLVVIAPSFTVNSTLVSHLPYSPDRDLRPVASLADTANVLAANPKVRAASLADLVSYAKANPGKLTYASFGNGTSPHLAGEMLKEAAKIDLVHVPYKGLAPAMSDTIAGQVDLMIGNLPEFLPQIRAGNLKAYGVTSLQRAALAPDLPTIAEQGYPGFRTSS